MEVGNAFSGDGEGFQGCYRRVLHSDDDFVTGAEGVGTEQVWAVCAGRDINVSGRGGAKRSAGTLPGLAKGEVAVVKINEGV